MSEYRYKKGINQEFFKKFLKEIIAQDGMSLRSAYWLLATGFWLTKNT